MKKKICVVLCALISSGIFGGLSDKCEQRKQLLKNYRIQAMELRVFPVGSCQHAAD